MAGISLIQDIKSKLFVNEERHIVVVSNPDGFLKTQAAIDAFADFDVDLRIGDSLDLRVLYETEYRTLRDKSLFLFVMREDFEVLDDLAHEVDAVTFQMRSFFRRYPWEVIRELPLAILEKLYRDTPSYQFSTEETTARINSYIIPENPEPAAKRDLAGELNNVLKGMSLYKAGESMERVSDIMLDALESERWEDISPVVDVFNVNFQRFLESSYSSIISSGCGVSAPKIVTHVLPFIKKQPEQNTALVVIDGMNYWQSRIFTKAIKDNLGLNSHTDCIFSWIPSTTEMSRQAIFRGDFPDIDYNQNPSSERSLWKAFWKENHCADFQIDYQHAGLINEEHSVTRMAYVEVRLDELMHACSNYYYLYDATKRWVREDQLLRNIKHLRERGYKIFVTTDHGNIGAIPYKRLPGQNKLNANFSYRHITIPPEADKQIFENEHSGHLWQIDTKSRTYFAAGNECFDSEPGVTHGGTHWMEVLIPFITIE